MDGWNTIVSYWVSAYFQGLSPLVSGRVMNTRCFPTTFNQRILRFTTFSDGTSKGGVAAVAQKFPLKLFLGVEPKIGVENSPKSSHV